MTSALIKENEGLNGGGTSYFSVLTHTAKHSPSARFKYRMSQQDSCLKSLTFYNDKISEMTQNESVLILLMLLWWSENAKFVNDRNL